MSADIEMGIVLTTPRRLPSTLQSSLRSEVNQVDS